MEYEDTKRNVCQLFVDTKSEMSLTRGPLASTRGVGGGRLGILTAFSRRLNSQFQRSLFRMTGVR